METDSRSSPREGAGKTGKNIDFVWLFVVCLPHPVVFRTYSYSALRSLLVGLGETLWVAGLRTGQS